MSTKSPTAEKKSSITRRQIAEIHDGLDHVVARTLMPMNWKPHGVRVYLPEAIRIGIAHYVEYLALIERRTISNLHMTKSRVDREDWIRIYQPQLDYHSTVLRFLESLDQPINTLDQDKHNEILGV